MTRAAFVVPRTGGVYDGNESDEVSAIGTTLGCMERVPAGRRLFAEAHPRPSAIVTFPTACILAVKTIPGAP